MNPTPLPIGAERVAPMPITAPPTLSQRAWKGFGATPWWRLVVGGLIVLTSVALFTMPFDSLRLQPMLQSAAAKQAFKVAVQKQFLERARSGLLSFRTITNDPVSVKEIDDAIGEVERELSVPKREIVVKSVAELQTLINAQQDDIKRISHALEQVAGKLTGGNDLPEATHGIEQFATKLEALQESVSQLQEMQGRISEFGATADGAKDKVITFNLLGKKLRR